MVQSSVRRSGRRNSHGQDSSYFMGWEEYKKNPYSPINNPHGIIQMGLAENQLSFDLLETWLADNPGAAGFDVNGGSVFRELALFQDYNGLPAFKKALADFMGIIRGDRVRFDPKKLVLTAGATSANEILMFCLAEPGDGFLVPTPYYPGFDRDLKWRTGAEIIPISCSISNSFQITRTALEEAYRRAGRSKIKVKGVLITNPSNPLGTTITRQELDTIIDFIQAKDIDLISDEIYSGTVFGSPDFISVREAIRNRPPKISTRTHIVCSLSKDLGLPGFRVGAIYSENVHVLTTATKMSSFGLISSQTQYLLAQMLSDIEFSKKYLEENRLRLERRHGLLVTGLMNAGIKCLRSNAGLFCWVDMRHLLKTSSFDGELELWKRLLYDVKLNVSPGSSCHCEEPGWFRVCFANMEEETLILAMERMQDFVQSYQVDDDDGGVISLNLIVGSSTRPGSESGYNGRLQPANAGTVTGRDFRRPLQPPRSAAVRSSKMCGKASTSPIRSFQHPRSPREASEDRKSEGYKKEPKLDLRFIPKSENFSEI